MSDDLIFLSIESVIWPSVTLDSTFTVNSASKLEDNNILNTNSNEQFNLSNFDNLMHCLYTLGINARFLAFI